LQSTGTGRRKTNLNKKVLWFIRK